MALIGALAPWPNARDIVHVGTAVLTFALVLFLLRALLAGEAPTLFLFEVMPGLPLTFAIEPLGMVFALLASGLWIVIAIYAIGYMRGNGEAHQTRFAMFFTLAIAAALGIAFSSNLFTLFIFYELLTLSTYPLVAHKGTPEARNGARTYLTILLSTSIGFFLIAIIWTWTAAGTLTFEPGGILEGHVDPALAPVLLALFAFGIGKAALMPFHRWLPAAMVAPAPVSALLHAVAVVKGGVFTLLKVGVYIFGTGYLSTTGASVWLAWVAAFTLIVSAIIAMTKDDLKARLAYSTISQLAYVTLGLALANQMGIIGGAMQMVMHAMAKITLFMCAGAIYVSAHKTRVCELDGLGRQMPFTFAAFLIASISIIGLPPLGGAWSKWFLLLAAADAHQTAMIAVLCIGSLLSIGYLMPVAGRALFLPSRDPDAPQGIHEAPLLCVVPLCVTALGCLLLFAFGNDIYAFLLHIPMLPPEAAP
ncbi:MAG: monovalent cation/H+ antiporter subunit D family protein [Parvibaculum sp.]|nr:monovalent cation/H+ antiporter subunit D family protein [Parvibaculum sp.]